MQVMVKDRQSLIDIAVQVLGGATGVFALAERNNICITDRLQDGQVLEWELEDTVDAKVQKAYQLRGIVPATDISQQDTADLLEATGSRLRDIILPPFGRDWRTELISGSVVWSVDSIRSAANGTMGVAVATTDGVVVDKIKQVQKQIANGEAVVSESGQTLVRLFTNQFNDVFA